MISEENPVLEFTANDRCDRCIARAYTLARKEGAYSELLFCPHHRRENYDALLDDGWEVIDDYEGLSTLSQNEEVFL